MSMDTTSELIAFLELALMLFTEPRTGVLLVLLAVAAVTDFRTFRIPNWLTGGGIAFALTYNLIAPVGGPHLAGALGGMLLGFLIMVPMYALRTMGAGDVKLMAMIGAFLGPQGVLFALLFSFTTAGAAAIAFASAHGALGRMFGNLRAIALGLSWSALGGVRPAAAPAASVGRLAFGISIAIGTTAYVVAQHFYLI